MGLFKLWKEAKAVAASGLASGPPGRPQGQGQGQGHPPGGMMAGFAGVMMKMMAPIMVAQAPERGEPLAGTESGVLDAQDPAALQAALAAVRARDSAFDAQVLTTFADQVFAAVCSVWGTGDASNIRSLLADQLWEPLSATLASGLGTGPGAIYSHQTGQGTLTGAWAGTWYDTARINIAVNLDVPVDEKHQIPPGFATNWNEDWLFQRSVKPGGDPMIVAESCPSCGAPTATDASGLCTHCLQPVPVLTSGWLVTCIRSHNPALEMARDQILNSMRQNPDELKMVPDELVKLLPPSAVAEIDPQRAAALGLQAQG